MQVFFHGIFFLKWFFGTSTTVIEIWWIVVNNELKSPFSNYILTTNFKSYLGWLYSFANGRDGSEHMLARRSLGAWCFLKVLGFWSLSTCSARSCSGLMLEEYSASIKGSLNSIKCGKNTEKIGSSNFTVDIRFTKKFQERKLSNKTFDRYEI